MGQKPGLRLGLHTLGHNLQIHLLGHGDDGGHQACVLRVDLDVLHKALVDL